MGCMSIVMAPLQIGAGGLVGDRTQGVARGLGEDNPGQGHLFPKASPLKGHSFRPALQYRMEASGKAA